MQKVIDFLSDNNQLESSMEQKTLFTVKKKNTAETIGTECIRQFGDTNYGLETVVGTRENNLGKCDKRSH